MKINNIKVSILIANYNNEKYLDECIKSLKNQTYKNLEIVIFDDASKDESVSKINMYEDIKFIKNTVKKEHGSFNQINAYKKAFELSSGEIIFFLDSDDFFSEKKIEKIIEHFNINDNHQIIFDLPIIKSKDYLKKRKNKKKIIKNFWPYIPPQSCISVRRETVEHMFKMVDFEKFPEIWLDFRIGIFAKYILKNFVIINENLTYYRIIETNVSSKFKFLSQTWWARRKQAHEYIRFFFNKNNIKYKKNIDYFLTYFVNQIL